ncbi:MAG: UPF0261 family protein [Candidatus Omnitrophota bacterium]|jgi:uncharacterized protein (UPF0261 family)|nr:MAG: UPF0261 family protein [Candidatus Omnitrophota bacterium]
MAKTILLIGTLDTKGEEFAYVRELIRARGHHALVMDAGIVGEPKTIADITAVETAESGGKSLTDLREQANRGEAIEAMTRGASRLAAKLHREGKIDGVMGLGGSGGTMIATAAMRELPVGFPKMMISTVTSGDIAPYVGVKDIAMMYSVVDIAGLNRLSRTILANGVGAICGMIEQEIPVAEDRPLLAATMFGVTTPCVDQVRERLEAAGYEVLVFHATGSGGKAMEALIEDGYIAGVADVTTTEWCDELVGGVLTAGPQRLEAAGRRGIPQVVSCGALDMVNFWAYDAVPAQFKQRNLYKHNPNVTLMRTTAEECAELGRIISEKLNRATGPTALVIPRKGVSAIDREGQPFHDPHANEMLFQTLRENIRPPVNLIELDLHINDPQFAAAVADCLLEMLTKNNEMNK